jgi:hypothetical protein
MSVANFPKKSTKPELKPPRHLKKSTKEWWRHVVSIYDFPDKRQWRHALCKAQG